MAITPIIQVCGINVACLETFLNSNKIYPDAWVYFENVDVTPEMFGMIAIASQISMYNCTLFGKYELEYPSRLYISESNLTNVEFSGSCRVVRIDTSTSDKFVINGSLDSVYIKGGINVEFGPLASMHQLIMRDCILQPNAVLSASVVVGVVNMATARAENTSVFVKLFNSDGQHSCVHSAGSSVCNSDIDTAEYVTKFVKPRLSSYIGEIVDNLITITH